MLPVLNNDYDRALYYISKIPSILMGEQIHNLDRFESSSDNPS